MDTELTEYIASLRAGIISLWNRLEVEQVVQEAFMNSCSGPKPSIAEKVSACIHMYVCTYCTYMYVRMYVHSCVCII